MKPAKPTFGAIVESIFLYEVDNNSIPEEIREYLPINDFWEELYAPRQNERETFQSFLTRTTMILLLSGHVGTGKTTFLREKLFFSHTCTGVIIDLRSRVHDLEKATNTFEFKKMMRSVVRDHYLVALKTHFLSFTIGSPEPKQIRRRKAKIDIAYHAMQLIEDDRDDSPLSKINAEAEILISKYHQRFPELNESKILESAYSEFSKLRFKEILDSLEWQHLIELYQSIIIPDAVHVIIFDNFDPIGGPLAYSSMLDCIIEMSEAVNINNEVAYTNATTVYNDEHLKPGVKFILALRDENIEKLKKDGAAATPVSQLTLGYGDFQISNADKHYELMIDSDIVYAIIAKRLSFLQKKAGSYLEFNAFREIIETFWIDQSKKDLRKGVDSLNVKQLCNSSLRLIFDMIFESSLQFVYKKFRNSVSIQQLLQSTPNQVLKGIIINSFWSSSLTADVMGSLGEGMIREIEGAKCCQTRLILAYLYNNRKDFVNTADLLSKLKASVDIDETAALKTLYILFASRTRQGEFITIYQNNPISTFSDIEKSSKIRLNEKGVIFFEEIIIHVDYINRISLFNPNEDDEERVLFELRPASAVEYLNQNLKFLRELVQQHLKILDRFFEKNYKAFSRRIAIAKFKKEFSKGDSFHLERTIVSHRNAIKSYLSNLFRHRDDHFLLDKATKYLLVDTRVISEQLGGLIDNEPVPFEDPVIQRAMNNIPRHDPLRKIWDIYRDFGDLLRVYNTIK
ncbi:MAG: hypothetical protein AAF998_07760 [Bacteroidota bacterium]